MNKLKISLVQSDLYWENIDSNLNKFESEILKAENANIFVLPEMFNTGFTNNVTNCSDTIDGKTVTWMKNISSVKNAVICGTIIIEDGGKFYNRFVFAFPNGKVLFYDKKHLFGMGGEGDIFSSGNNRIIIEIGAFKILPLICYDLRFPVWSRNFDDYDAIIYTSSWPASRRNNWDVLLQARAVENQCYVVGVNRVGIDGNNINYDGGSCIIDPAGNKILAANNDKEEIVSGIIDKAELDSFRKKFPFLKDRDDFLFKV
ncbi:MAG: amidohydrolase [Bacteroidales bacterium]|jgi:predicted amidohydrolase|nr:amidohydrolase [Bacteroidales bacterium]